MCVCVCVTERERGRKRFSEIERDQRVRAEVGTHATTHYHYTPLIISLRSKDVSMRAAMSPLNETRAG